MHGLEIQKVMRKRDRITASPIYLKAWALSPAAAVELEFVQKSTGKKDMQRKKERKKKK